MSIHIWRYDTEFDSGNRRARGWCVHIEIWRVMFDFAVAWG